MPMPKSKNARTDLLRRKKTVKQKLRLRRNRKLLKKLSVKQIELKKVRVGKPKRREKSC